MFQSIFELRSLIVQFKSLILFFKHFFFMVIVFEDNLKDCDALNL